MFFFCLFPLAGTKATRTRMPHPHLLRMPHQLPQTQGSGHCSQPACRKNKTPYRKIITLFLERHINIGTTGGSRDLERHIVIYANLSVPSEILTLQLNPWLKNEAINKVLPLNLRKCPKTFSFLFITNKAKALLSPIKNEGPCDTRR